MCLSVCALSLLAGRSLFAQEKIELETTLTSSGGLVDNATPWTGKPNKVEPADMVIRVGSNYGVWGAAIFEFPLPPAEKTANRKLRSALLDVVSNPLGEVRKECLSPLDADLYSYDGDTADGAVTLADWDAGKLVGRWWKKGETKVTWGTHWSAMDVTAVVQAAMDGGKKFIGFRLKPEGIDQATQQVVCVRTFKFGQKFGGAPKLTLQFE